MRAEEIKREDWLEEVRRRIYKDTVEVLSDNLFLTHKEGGDKWQISETGRFGYSEIKPQWAEQVINQLLLTDHLYIHFSEVQYGIVNGKYYCFWK